MFKHLKQKDLFNINDNKLGMRRNYQSVGCECQWRQWCSVCVCSVNVMNECRGVNEHNKGHQTGSRLHAATVAACEERERE